MDTLLLIRHSLPDIKPEIPSTEWNLSSIGRERCKALARLVKVYAPQAVITSLEPKAFQTGASVARDLGIQVSTWENLHEHERDPDGYTNRLEFEKRMADFFAHPDEIVLGTETARQALERISGALEAVMERYPEGNILVVSHGTVMALWSTHLTGEDPFSFWKKLGMPAVGVFSRPELKLLELIDHVE